MEEWIGMKSLHNSLDDIQPCYFNSRIIITSTDDYSVLLLIKKSCYSFLYSYYCDLVLFTHYCYHKPRECLCGGARICLPVCSGCAGLRVFWEPSSVSILQLSGMGVLYMPWHDEPCWVACCKAPWVATSRYPMR